MVYFKIKFKNIKDNIIEDMEDNCRNQFYREERFSRRYDMKKVSSYLRKLKENGDDYKIKHVKKLYQIYTIFYQIKSLIYSKDTFEYTDKVLSTNDFYSFLIYIIECLRSDIIKFVDIIQDDNFNNNVLVREILDDDGETLRDNLDEAMKKFNVYLNFKHFR